jgi:hypothetical protein
MPEVSHWVMAIWCLGVLVLTVLLPFLAFHYPRGVLLVAELCAALGWCIILGYLAIYVVGWEGSQLPHCPPEPPPGPDCTRNTGWLVEQAFGWWGMSGLKIAGVLGFTLPIMIFFVFCRWLLLGNVQRSRPDGIVAGSWISKVIAKSTLLPRLPTSVPGAQPAPSAIDRLREASLVQDRPWQSLIVLLACVLPRKRCWKVTGTVIDEGAGRIKIVAKVVDRRTNRSMLTPTRTGRSVNKAASEIGYAIAAEALNQTASVSRWTSWHQADGKGLAKYHYAQEKLKEALEGRYERTASAESAPEAASGAERTPPKERSLGEAEDNLRDAEDNLREAARIEPGNLLVRLELAKICELRGHKSKRAEALELYLRTVRDCPKAVQATYRAAIACNVLPDWEDLAAQQSEKGLIPRQFSPMLQRSGTHHCPVDMNPEQCARISRLLRLVPDPPGEARPVTTVTQSQCHQTSADRCALMDLARETAPKLLYLTERELTWRMRLWRAVLPGFRDPALRPAGWRALQFRRSVKVTHCLLDLAQDPKRRRTYEDYEKKVRRLTHCRKPWTEDGNLVTGADFVWRHLVNWQTHYNAACFYSSAIPLLEPGPEQNSYMWASLAHLSRAVYDSAGALPIDSPWLVDHDPDLNAVRRVHRGVNWKNWLAWMKSEIPGPADTFDASTSPGESSSSSSAPQGPQAEVLAHPSPHPSPDPS